MLPCRTSSKVFSTSVYTHQCKHIMKGNLLLVIVFVFFVIFNINILNIYIFSRHVCYTFFLMSLVQNLQAFYTVSLYLLPFIFNISKIHVGKNINRNGFIYSNVFLIG